MDVAHDIVVNMSVISDSHLSHVYIPSENEVATIYQEVGL